MNELTLLLLPIVLAASMLSGIVGMGGGVILLAVMASLLSPALVVPLHGLIQLISNSTRSFILLKNVHWKIFLLYLPSQILGVFLATAAYRGSQLEWFRPAIGAFILAYLLWDRFKPRKIQLPMWIFLPAGLLGGILTILVGASGPYLAAFFLRKDLEKEQVVATKAMIQTVGHFLKIPAFLSIGFAYQDHMTLVAPLLILAVAGTWLGTRILRRMDHRWFAVAFRGILLILAIRLLVDGLGN